MMTDVKSLDERLRGSRWDSFETAVRAAVAGGAAGEAALVAALPQLPVTRRTLAVAALGTRADRRARLPCGSS